MASKKVNPEQLAKLAKQKAGSAAQFRKAEEAGKKKGSKPKAPVSPTTTVPPSPPSTDVWDFIGGGTTSSTTPSTTTSTTIPSVTPTTVPPPITTPTTTVPSRKSYLEQRIAEGEAGLLGKYTGMEIEKIKNEPPKKKGFWDRFKSAVGVTLNSPVGLPLKAWGFVGRLGPSAFEESVQIAKGLTGRTQRYEATDYIPNYPGTNIPIAKVGDPVILNDEEILNTPFSDEDIKKIKETTTDSEYNLAVKNAVDNVVKGNKRTSSGSAKEFLRQAGTPWEFNDYGFGSIKEVQIGRHLEEKGIIGPELSKWIDRGIGLGGDIALDPTTYATLGTSTAPKIFLKGVDNAGTRTSKLIVAASDDLLTKTAKEVTDDVLTKAAKEFGTEVSESELKRIAAAVVAEASQLAKQKVTTAAQKALVDKSANAAARRWSKLGPKRTAGAGARQSLATSVKNLKDEAETYIKSASVLGDTPELRAAQRFVDVIDDDVIADIALNGNRALKGEVADVLSLPGGLRWGLGTYKLGSPNITRKLTGGRVSSLTGEAVSRARRGFVGTTAGRKFTEATTRIGEGGLFGSQFIYDWRTGLKTGKVFDAAVEGGYRKLTTDEIIESLSRLAEDQTYRALKKASGQTIKVGVDSVFKDPANRKYFNTVHTLLEDQTIDWTKAAYEIARDTGRSIEEIDFALKIINLKRDFENIIDNLLQEGLTDSFGPSIPDNWFPQALTDKAVTWLSNVKSPQVKSVLSGLNLDRPPLPGDNFIESLMEGAVFFGRELKDTDIAGGVARFNEIARQGGFKGDFFEINAAAAVSKWARKFADDYAFLRKMTTDNVIGTAARPWDELANISTQNAVIDVSETSAYQLIADANAIDYATAAIDDPIIMNVANQYGLDLIEARRFLSDVQAVSHLMTTPTYAVQGVETLLVKARLSSYTEDLVSAIKTSIAYNENVLRSTPRTVANEGRIDFGLEYLEQLRTVVDGIDNGLKTGKTPVEIWDAISSITETEYRHVTALLTHTPDEITKLMSNVKPHQLAGIKNIVQDAFVTLDSAIVPDIMVRADVAKMYSNLARFSEPKFQNMFLRYWNDYIRFMKAWVTSTPGFHTRNAFSNAFQMVAGGAKVEHLWEAVQIMNRWNAFLKKEIASAGRLGDPEDLWRRFVLNDEKLIGNKVQAEAFYNTIIASGGAGFGDIEEVFGSAVPSSIGFFGKEAQATRRFGKAAKEGKLRKRLPTLTVPEAVPVIGGRAVPGSGQTAAELAGAIPRTSRSIGGKIEDYSRFMMTYDGIRQGYSPQMAADRTARFLIDYEDLTKLDQVAKQFVPFWMWMSRNLPVQMQNMWLNPGVYNKYLAFRKNFEDEEGNNALVPAYLKEAGVFKIPFGSNIYLKPDLGFPTAGSPSPLTESVTDVQSLIAAIPGLSIASILGGEQPLTGYSIPRGERPMELLKAFVPPIGTAERYLKGVQGITDAEKRRNLLSLFGAPVTLMNEAQQNIARQEIIDKLQPYLDELKKERGG